MADGDNTPQAPDPVAIGQAIGNNQQMPDVGQANPLPPTLAPQPAQRVGAKGVPLLGQMLADLIRPSNVQSMQAPAPGQLATMRPVSRAQDFEGFLGQFLYAMGQGFANEGRGPGAAYRGAGAAITAPIQLQMQQQQLQSQIAQQQAQAQQSQAEAGLKQAQAQPINVPGIGNIPAASVGGYFGMQGRLGAANIAAQGKINAIEAQTRVMAGELNKMVPDVVNGQQGYRMFNKFGQEIGFSDATVIPQLMARTSSTVTYQQDADGNIVALPKTTVTRPNIPGGGAPTPAPAEPPIRPSAGAGAAPVRPPINQPGAAAPQQAGPRVVMQGKAARDVGKGFDPQTGEWVETSRSQAPQQGLQQFTKYTGNEQENYRQLNNRLADVATKITRYEDSLNDPISNEDRGNIAGVLASDKLKIGAFGAELPVDRLNQAMDEENIKGMSKAAQNRVIAYANARESLQGYQRVLTGGSHSSETGLQLQLQALPSPVMPDDYTRMGIDQFKENVNVAGQGLPRQLGMTRAKDIFAQRAKANLSPQLQKILNSFPSR